MMKKALATTLAATMLLGTAGMVAGAEEKSVEGMTVAFIPKVTGNAFFESANDGAQEFAEKWGITVEYMGSSVAGAAEQVEVIHQAINTGVDAICISTVDAAGVSDALKEAADMGITVCTWDSDANVEDRALMVSQGTPEVLGKMLVDMGVDGLTKRGKDPAADPIKYCWHYSQATVTDQNSWQVAGEAYIKENYPNWENVAPDNYYSEQDSEKAVNVGAAVLDNHSDIDLILCNDSTALPGQLQAAQNAGLTKDDITITGFASPNSIKEFCKAGVLYEWGLWDCKIQGAMGCYVAAYLAAGNEVKVGDTISIPEIGDVTVEPNESIAEGAATGDVNNGVVLLPERAVFDETNMDDYNF
ncbi:MAG: substrate-binding domain-containing protein [Lachnospiraceae bacterium]|uniref:substrate-binding domain-containing protein n=1 Tax=Parablautia sp. Marseille-Q6255 TaxID=3039593 RepID=UPI0024BBF578|nr:substrate-binding domain-containing protein [Parablautia sp. Marseille-Q6255]